MNRLTRIAGLMLALVGFTQAVAQQQSAQQQTVEVGATESLLAAYNQLVSGEKLAAGNTQVYVVNNSSATFYDIVTLADFLHLTRITSELGPNEWEGPVDLGRRAKRVRLLYRRHPSGPAVFGPLVQAPAGMYIYSLVFVWNHHGDLETYPWFEPLP